MKLIGTIFLVTQFVCVASFGSEWHVHNKYSIAHFILSGSLIPQQRQGAMTHMSGIIRFQPGHLDSFNASLSIDSSSIKMFGEAQDLGQSFPSCIDPQYFPKIDMRTIAVRVVNAQEFSVLAAVRLHGVTRREVFQFVFDGIDEHYPPGDQTLLRFTAKGKIHLSQYGVNCRDATDITIDQWQLWGLLN